MTKAMLLEALADFPDDTDIRLLRWNDKTGYGVFMIHPTLNQESLQKHFERPTFCLYYEQFLGNLDD